jgi:aminopeptidase N
MFRLLRALPIFFSACFAWAAAAPSGVPRELAIARAQTITDIRYHLSYDLTADAIRQPGNVPAHEELRFRLKQAVALWVDFREGAVATLSLNGTQLSAAIENGHLWLPAAALRAGENTLSADFTAPIAAAGKALTRYEDKDDGSTYIYTLFVPMDASMAFPCFDQPDLKGRFRLDLTAPRGWTVIANSAIESAEESGAKKHVIFGETRPISTYLFAFAAGPFQNVHPTAGMPNIYVRQSQVARAQSEVPAMQSLVARATQFLSGYFAQPFPFPKYEMVLLPGFAFGGMEHAGATFLREDSMLFRSAPTDTDRFNRGITLVHELAHQWFGDFVTMRWFDDLWLKEGFAQYMAYRAMAEIAPRQDVWKRFYQNIKPAAYGIDVTRGTTPIYQDISNLKDAKSAYGAIVYSKAPALLRQLAFLLGDEAFRGGLRIYLKEHAYANAEWKDLVHALERSSGQKLGVWADNWIRRRGMPQVRAMWSCDANHQLKKLTLQQRDVLDTSAIWPIATQIRLGYGKGEAVQIKARFSTASADIPEAVGKACPDYVFPNDEDYAYGLFLLDERSRAYTMAHLAAISDLFERTLLWGAFWDAVRFTELAPRDYLTLLLARMPGETDEALVQSLGSHAVNTLQDYVNAQTRQEFNRRFEQIAIDGLQHGPSLGLRIMWFRNIRSLADSPVGLAELRDLLNGRAAVAGVELRPLDRWNMVTALLAHGDSQAQAIYAAEQQRDHMGDGLKYSYIAAAAKPDAATKQKYFHDYLTNASRPEDWVEQSLGAFNYWNQAELTAPYLRLALQALPQVKRQRKIFFMLAWLNAFIGGQSSEAADTEVHRWLSSAEIDPDLRLKVLQVVDELDRTVKIRKRFP